MTSAPGALCALLMAVSVATCTAEARSLRNASSPSATFDTSRIVSIGGAVTEILYALGLERRIVAVDTTSTYPPRALREKPNVGYMRQLSPEGILGLSPSLIIAAEGAGPAETMAVLEAAKVPLVHIPDRFDGDGIVEKVRLIARASGTEEHGACLVRLVEADLAALADLRRRIQRPPQVAFVLSLVNGRPNVAGRNTAAEGIIQLAGAVNAIGSFEGYKLVNDEALIAARPDAVLVMQRASHPLDAATVLGHPAFAASPAAKRNAFIAMDGQYLLGFGPRTARAARDLAAALHPAQSFGALPSDVEQAACE